MHASKDYGDRRECPRISVDLPLEYRVLHSSYAHGGVAANASGTGLLMYAVQDLALGCLLDITILFLKEFELMELEARAEIVWKDIRRVEAWRGYEYGLKFVQLEEKDHGRLLQLLSGSPQREETSCCGKDEEPLDALQA
jgi:hypothetical protein